MPDTEFLKVVRKRISACSLENEEGVNPFDEALLLRIYDAARGSLRDTFNICTKLCLAVSKSPLFETIPEHEAERILGELQAPRLRKVGENPLQNAVLLEIGNSPGINQKELAKTLGKQQPAVSRALKVLAEADLVRSERDGTATRYRLSPEVCFALK